MIHGIRTRFARLRRDRSTAALLVAVTALAFAAAGAQAPAAHAATQCSLANGILEVHMTKHLDVAEFQTVGGNITVRGEAGPVTCAGGPPTTTNTDTVLAIDDSDRLATPAPTDGSTTLYLRNPASFSPGKTPEGAPGRGEIEFVVNMNAGNDDELIVEAGPGGSDWTAGSGGFDWTGDRSRDLLGGPFDEVELAGHDGADRISAQGGGTTGAPLTAIPTVVIQGHAGSDTLLGSNLGDDIFGHAGDDVIEGHGGDDRVRGWAGNDTVTGGAGTDILYSSSSTPGVTVDLGRSDRQDTREGLDQLAGFEGVIGTLSADTLIGGDGGNVLIGLEGDDTLDGRGGSDALLGESGADTIVFERSPGPVTVDLAAKSAVQGAADADTLDGIENVIGSPFADKLTGDAGANLIEGGAGADTVAAGAGADRVVLRDGEADTAGCGADADTVVTDRRTVDTIAADCETVDALPQPQPTPATSGQQPTQSPDRSLSFALTGASSQRLIAQKAVHVRVRSPLETATIVASASGRLSGERRASTTKLRLTPVSTVVGAGQTKTLKLRLTKASLAALRKALAAKRRPTVKVTAQARDAAGNRVVRTLRVKAKR
jgi:Ca2+-binding RTX toxin-like protein